MMNQLVSEEKPRERCLIFGPECLSLRECFAILLGSGPKGEGCLGLARRLLLIEDDLPASEDEFFRRVENNSEVSLHGIKGLGPAGQAKFLAALEIARRYSRFKQKQNEKKVKISLLPQAVKKQIPEQIKSSLTETIGFVPYFSDKSIGRFQVVQSGCDMGVTFQKQHFLRLLLFSRAEGFWMFHNHPDGSIEVSEADRRCTREIKTLSRMLGIQFFGHWIIAGQNWISI